MNGWLTLDRVADELTRRIARMFLRGADGRRPLYGEARAGVIAADAEADPLFYEYFDGDTGRGLGAAHQTGWTALVAVLLSKLADGGG